MEVFIEHKEVFLIALLAVSECLALIPAVKANSIFQVVLGLFKSLKGK